MNKDLAGNEFAQTETTYGTPPAASAARFTDAHNALNLVDMLLVEAGYAQDSSVRHNLAIAKSIFNEAERCAPSSGGVALGWKLVPEQPTIEMLNAADTARPIGKEAWHSHSPVHVGRRIGEEIYTAMLAAAPSAAPAEGVAFDEWMDSQYTTWGEHGITRGSTSRAYHLDDMNNAYHAGMKSGTRSATAPAAPSSEGVAMPDVEAVSAHVHDAWMDSKRAQGVKSRKAEDGEELMVPYEQLSEKAKELDRSTVKAVYAAIASARDLDEVLSAAPAAGEKCSDGLTPDGPTCPRCGAERALFSRGGKWVHFPERLGHDDAQRRIAECVREIEILADQFGYDPYEWLVSDEAGIEGRTRSASAPAERVAQLERALAEALEAGRIGLENHGADLDRLEQKIQSLQSASAPSAGRREEVERICRAVCRVEGIDPDEAIMESDSLGTRPTDPRWTAYADAVESALSASAPEGVASPCPACGTNLADGTAGWGALACEYDRQVLDLIDEVLAARRGAAVTHQRDPVPDLQQRIGSRADVDAREALFNRAHEKEQEIHREAMTSAASATGGKNDPARIDWMEKRKDGFANIDRITSTGRSGFNGYPTMRQAIDEQMANDSDSGNDR